MQFDCGLDDYFIDSNRLFSQQLNSSNIPHVFLEYEGTHNNKIAERVEDYVLPFFSAVFSD